MTPTRRLLPIALAASLFAAGPASAGELKFDRVVIDADFPGAYQVEVAAVNGDGKPDVVAVGGGTCAWYENPGWTKRLVSTPRQTPGIISSATRDLDGDGKAEIAIAYEFAMNEPRKGKLLLASQGKGVDDPWTLAHVADVGSIHRLRWHYQLVINSRSIRFTPVLPGQAQRAKNDEFKGPSLLVAPIFGPSAKPPTFEQEPAHLVSFHFAKSPTFAPGGGIGGGTGALSRPTDPPGPVFHEKL